MVNANPSLKFEATNLDGLYPVLDGIAWLDHPTNTELSQFSGLDPRTVGKILKNAININLVESIEDGYRLRKAYPYRGAAIEKSRVVQEALLEFPLLTSMRQFIALGDSEDDSLRKAATMAGIVPFDPANFKPLISWAKKLDALTAGQIAEDLIDRAAQEKETRQLSDDARPVAFLSHSSVDKPFIRQLASDLIAAGVAVWLDEHEILVGDSIPEKISQGLAAADYFLIALSHKSVGSQWVSKELNNALMREIQKRQVHVLPLKLEDVEIPDIISDKKYADFTGSYKDGLAELKRVILERRND